MDLALLGENRSAPAVPRLAPRPCYRGRKY